LEVKELSHCGGTNSWYTIKYKGKSAGKVHFETKWTQYSFKEAEETKETHGKGFVNIDTPAVESGELKMMLVSLDLTQGEDQLKDYTKSHLYVKWELRNKEDYS
jgi:Ca2+-dependent lipid-binding protein